MKKITVLLVALMVAASGGLPASAGHLLPIQEYRSATCMRSYQIIHGAKFPPLGRRGGESYVRSAGFSGPGFSWAEYTMRSNSETLVIPMDEDYEFTDNLDEILDVPGVDAVNFGPIDYSLSIGAKVGYATEDSRVADAYEKLARGCAERCLGVMCPVVPGTRENIEAAIKRGITMLILGNDMHHLSTALKTMKEKAIDPYRTEHGK